MILLLAASAPALGQARRVYLAPDDHTDYMWSGDEETYRRVFLEMLDYYLALVERTAGLPPEQQSRWNTDGTYWVWTYQKNRTAKEFGRLIGRIRDGRIGVPLNALVSCYGGMPTEAVLRGMYYAGTLERRHGLRFPLAVAMENQTLPYGLGALWAGSGARYSWKGICDCATRIRNTPRPYEAYWWRGPDGSRLLMKWNSLLEDNRSVGGYAEAARPEQSLQLAENDPRFLSRWPYSVTGLFGKGWDDLKTLSDEFVRVAREKTTAARKVVVSNVTDFFEDFERTHGRELPEYAAAFGNEWDLYSASMPEVSARVRRAVEALRAAEAMAVLAGLREPSFLEGRAGSREQAWMNLGLYWEHNWTADGRVVTRQARAGWQRRLAAEIESYVYTLHREAAGALGGLIARTGARPRFFVFNPLGWGRNDAADLPYDGPAEVHVVDLAAGRAVPSQVVTLPDAGHQRGLRRLRVWAAGVPAVGYRVFEIRPGRGEEFPPAAHAGQGTLENAAYRLRMEDRGAISSLIDKSRPGREFARPADGLWINDLGLGGGMLSIDNAGPVSATLTARAFSPLPHTSRITLYRDSRRIDIENEITRNFGAVEQWTFSFNLDDPDIRHEELGAILRARLLKDGGHYSPVNSRLDWLTLNHFLSISGPDGAGITLSNRDCAFFKPGNSAIAGGVSFLDTQTPLVRVLAGGQVDGPKLGIPNQGGDSRFLQRFSLQVHDRFRPADAMRFALEHQNPLVTGPVRGGGPYPEHTWSLVAVSDPNVLLWSLKPAEEGIQAGVIARLWNLEPEDRSFTLALTGGIQSAMRATHIETDLEPAAVSSQRLAARIPGHALRTYRLRPRPGR